MTNLKKPQKNKHYSDRSLDILEDDRSFMTEADAASEDLSVKGEQELSDSELLRRFRESQVSNILPKIPAIAGFHTCWVPFSSNNLYDTVDHRRQLGYELVKMSEVPGYTGTSNRGGQFDGCVTFNELVLMKIPERHYQLYMKDSHHTQPIEQERVIKQRIQEKMIDKEGKSLIRDSAEMSGINSLARKVRDPVFN